MAPTFAPTRAYTALQLLLIQLEAAADAWALCMVASVTALLFMVTAREATTVYIYGFPLPVNSKWSFANAFEYLVEVSATVATHSLIDGSLFRQKDPPPRCGPS
ncbi:hypothetical protein ACFX2I_037590 [Malus domestica]